MQITIIIMNIYINLEHFIVICVNLGIDLGIRLHADIDLQ